MKNKVQMLLDRLSKVRATGGGRWVACCSAHQDKTPSLAITLKDDKILLHCFSGCSVEDILESVGMTLQDLFPENLNVHRKSDRIYFSYEQIFLAMKHEATIILTAADMMANGEQLTPDDLGRVRLAGYRIEEANSYVD